MNVIFEPLFEGVVPPVPSTEWSAGLDAVAWIEDRPIRVVDPFGTGATYSNGEVWISGGARCLIPLGFRAQLPEGWECQVRPRSGLAFNKGLTVLNSPGTIDADYPGEWGVILLNTSKIDVCIRHGDRIAQLVLQPVHRLSWAPGKVQQVTDRAGGIGSTGG